MTNDYCTQYGNHHFAHVGHGVGSLEQKQGHWDQGYPLGHNIKYTSINKVSCENKIYIQSDEKHYKNLIKVVSIILKIA